MGLIHNIGRIYLLSRAPTYPELFASPEAIAQTLGSWHSGVAKAIVEFWHLPPETALAVELQDEIDNDPDRHPMVAVLTVAIALRRSTRRLPRRRRARSPSAWTFSCSG